MVHFQRKFLQNSFSQDSSISETSDFFHHNVAKMNFQMIGLTWILAIISAYPVFTRAESGSITSNMSHLNDNCGVNWAQGIKML